MEARFAVGPDEDGGLTMRRAAINSQADVPALFRKSPAALKTLAAVHPNAGLEALYRAKLDALVDELHNSLAYWIGATYKAKPPELAQDDAFIGMSPAMSMREAMRKLSRRWLRNFDQAAPKLAAWFATAAFDRSDRALMKILRDGGFSVKFQLSREANDVLQATIGENVALIKSIGAQHLSEVEGAVMRSVQAGRDLGTLSKELEARYGVTKRRAALISQHQNNLATASIQRVRQQALGIKQAVWIHSHAGKHPRPSHVKAGAERIVYDVDKGWFDPDEGRYIRPGELINCFPGDMPVTLENGLLRLWRAPFHGPMIHFSVGADLLKGTANHPILTRSGWVPLGELEDGDEVVCMAQKCRQMVDDDKDQRVTTFAQLFESLVRAFGHVSRDAAGFDFHGDLVNNQVNEVVVGKHHLLGNINPTAGKNAGEFGFSEADGGIGLTGCSSGNHVPASDGPGAADEADSFGGIESLHSDGHGLALAANRDRVTHQNVPHVPCGRPLGAEVQRNCSRSKPGLVELNDLGGSTVPVGLGGWTDADGAQFLAQLISGAANARGGSFQIGTRLYEFRSLSNKSIRDFSGHVYTLQSFTGNYSVSSASVQAKNCRCVSRPVIPGFN